MKKLKLKNILEESAFAVNRNQKKQLGDIVTAKDMPPFAMNEREWLKKWGLVHEANWNKSKIEKAIDKYGDVLIFVHDGKKDRYLSLTDSDGFDNKVGFGTDSDGKEFEFQFKNIEFVSANGKRITENVLEEATSWNKKDYYGKYKNFYVGIKNFYKNAPEDKADDMGYEIYEQFGKLAEKLAKKHGLDVGTIEIHLK